MDNNTEKKIDIRNKIDRIDEDLVDLLSRRLKLVKKITLLKFGEKITNQEREEEILSKAKYNASIHGLDKKFISIIFELILINSKQEQKKIIK